MFLSNPVSTVRMRLALWYACLLSAFAALLFLCEGQLLQSQLLSRTDDELSSQARQFIALYEEFGLKVLQDEFRRGAEAIGVDNIVFVLRSPHQIVLAHSDMAFWQGLSPSEPGGTPAPGDVRHVTRDVPDERRQVRFVELRTQDGNLLQIGCSLAQDRALLAAYRRVFAVVVLGFLLFGSVLGWALTGRAMAGVSRVTRAARRIGNSDLITRVPIDGSGAEIRDLACAFNEMLDRIGSLVAEIQQVSDNVAHDLRGPLTRIRGLAEQVSLSREVLPEHQEAAGIVVGECDRLAQIIDTMLEIAETQAGVQSLARTDVDLVDVVRDACDLFEAVAADRGVSLTLVQIPSAAAVRGDKARLQRAVANIIDNAVKYTPDGRSVSVSVDSRPDTVHVIVKDTGIGISQENLGKVFDRFFRADPSRSSRGSGLGLPLARAIARAHGGEVRVWSEQGKGSTFEIELPSMSGSSSPS